jgi:hypothetical protein
MPFVSITLFNNESYEVTLDDNDPSYNTIPNFFPTSIKSMKLSVLKATSPNELVGEQNIPFALYGTNSIQITDPDLLNAIKNQSLGDTFTFSITANYTPDSFPTGDEVACQTVTNETIKKIPECYANTLTYDYTTEEHYGSETVSSNGDGDIIFESSDQSVLSIDPETGKYLPVSEGIVTVTMNQSNTSVFEAMTTQQTAIVTPTTVTFVPLVLNQNNGVTIRYTGNPSNVPSGSPLFFQAVIRGTPEWFAVVNQSSFQAIRNYANGTTGPFIPPGQTTPVPFNNIVTTLMTNMSSMFANATTFNYNISSWDTSRVMDMSFMFNNATTFDQPLNSWNTSWVTNMASMFANARTFNQAINSWDTSWVRNMASMFNNAIRFNQPLNNWNISNVAIMHMMFSNAINFNQNISGWNVSRVFVAFGFRQNSALSLANTPNFIIWI